MTGRTIKWARSENRYGCVEWRGGRFTITRRDNSLGGGVFYVLDAGVVPVARWMRVAGSLTEAKDNAEMIENPEWEPA